MSRAEYICPENFRLLLTALMPANRFALLTSEETGLRIGDVLRLKPQQVAKQRFTVVEQKTGKRKRVYLPQRLQAVLLQISGRYWVFEGRLDPKKPRTRSAVYKDLKRVAALYRLDGKKIRQNLSPHSARKIYAVQQYKQSGNLRRVQELLNHSDEAVTLLYAMADQLTDKRLGG